jgi:hypothetical protein
MLVLGASYFEREEIFLVPPLPLNNYSPFAVYSVAEKFLFDNLNFLPIFTILWP